MGPVNYGGGPNANNGTSAQFSPYSAIRPEPSTANAVRVYEGDKAILRSAGATFVGDLDVDTQQHLQLPFDSKRPNYDGLAPRAALEAGKVGATHFILVDAGVDVTEYTVQDAHEETETQVGYDQYGRKHVQSVTTHRPEKTIKTAAQRGRYALFRVDPSRWGDLPPQLRPLPLDGVAVGTTTLTAAAQEAKAQQEQQQAQQQQAQQQPVTLPPPNAKSSSKAAIKKAGY